MSYTPVLGRWLPVAGGTMSGPLTLNADPNTDVRATTKQYADNTLLDTNTWRPKEQTNLAWNYDPVLITTTGSTASGTVFLTQFRIHKPVTITGIRIDCYDKGTQVAGQNFFGLYDSNGSRVAVTADVALASYVLVSKPFTAPYAAVPGVYFAAILLNFTGTPQLQRRYSNAPTCININKTAPFRFSYGPTGQTSLPASIALGSVTPSPVLLWVALY